ncbi:MAG: isochorismatase family protein [Calditerrivibrio sp.]|nr:isochorismatase family protein [Calditerrivibrio sp.]MCA1932509.1 isochorismatase family protein [Calditerrivibrio sp.]MCA1980434.1 isochorismatase family protein [Calditerrivibrio sp.]
MFTISTDNTSILVIDVQKNLIKAMDQEVYNFKLQNMIRIAKAAKILRIPYYITQQYTKGLGGTVDELTAILGDSFYEKISFSCCRDSEFTECLDLNTPNILVMGMETHVCVLQTVLDLLDSNYRVFVVADAVMSRTKENWKIGLKYMNDAGAMITSTEIAIFQLLKKAGTDEFRDIVKILK